ncbi:WecB/TagA/CpsF family glycosyltransferase [Paenibacillus arenosi]|uniref:N-acetylglucosaminyldiphosphoundecaprenol N-acetyl-beta-D-mannosaminyltransferase n=1 Tax=Paenibacillus arenosi TaxID=2774142 RepID=A0ABR9AX06_9BACL|nr:WecB/TagA/CpsF family glycosyltransferase [Paenibacillus arenosi]
MNPTRDYATVSIYGVPFSKMTMQETVDWMTSAIAERRPTHVITANPIILMNAIENERHMRIMEQADIIVADGTGIVWAADYIGDPLRERVTGFDLLYELMKQGNEKGWKVYMLGAAPEVVEAAASRLQQLYPGIQIVGCRDGFFTEKEDEAVINEIIQAQPDLLFVARGAETQEPWIARYREQLNVPIMMGVGGSFDVISGKLKRAPKWMRSLRLEWFYRLIKEPWRYKRMLALPRFVWKVVRDKGKVKKK